MSKRSGIDVKVVWVDLEEDECVGAVDKHLGCCAAVQVRIAQNEAG